MARLRPMLPLALGLALAGGNSICAKPAFISSVIEGPGSQILFADLDGDHLKDAILVDGLNLSIFYQDSKQGFPREAQQRYRLAQRPSLVWPARLGEGAESLLVMTSEGVSELCFTNRIGAPVYRQIIRERTFLPEAMDEPGALCLPFAVDTRTEWPLVLVPAAGGLQVWSTRGSAATGGAQRGQEWRPAQVLEHTVEDRTYAAVTNAGYDRVFALDWSVGDVNGDGRDDLMVARGLTGGLESYALYLQRPDGLFNPEPALLYTNKPDWRDKLCWVDLNGDGKVDLVKSSFVDEPFFVPGMRSAKVLVGVYPADARGRIPAEPQQVFRKNDWSCWLPMVDVDGDGLVDLVLGYMVVESREGLLKVLTADKADFSLRFHFGRPGTGFPSTSDCQREVALHFRRELPMTLEHRLYYERLISLNGDFNGDGRKDLLVRDRSDGISVYFFLSREKGFSPEPDLKFSCPESIDWWGVRELNDDGISDLVVKLSRQNMFRIFTSPGK